MTVYTVTDYVEIGHTVRDYVETVYTLTDHTSEGLCSDSLYTDRLRLCSDRPYSEGLCSDSLYTDRLHQ